jgi:hypothetical protein
MVLNASNKRYMPLKSYFQMTEYFCCEKLGGLFTLINSIDFIFLFFLCFIIKEDEVVELVEL